MNRSEIFQMNILLLYLIVFILLPCSYSLSYFHLLERMNYSLSYLHFLFLFRISNNSFFLFLHILNPSSVLKLAFLLLFLSLFFSLFNRYALLLIQNLILIQNYYVFKVLVLFLPSYHLQFLVSLWVLNHILLFHSPIILIH